MTDFHEAALEDVVDTIMLFGEYPQPNRHRTGPRKFFSLLDFLRSDKSPIDAAEAYEFLVSGLTDYDSHMDARFKLEMRVKAALTEHLKDSEIVSDRAGVLQEEAHEESL